MEKLQTFSPYELNLLLCGEQVPNWSREDILNYTEPKYGYNKERCVNEEEQIGPVTFKVVIVP